MMLYWALHWLPKAQIIVTGDRDLLVLNPWNEIQIIDSSETIQALIGA